MRGMISPLLVVGPNAQDALENLTASEQLHCYSTISHPGAITRDMVCEVERDSGGSRAWSIHEHA